MIGKATIKTYCKGQAVIALSSGESEYYGLVSGISQGLGEKAMLADWDISVDVQLWMDATAGIAIGSRRGLGRVKHIDTVFLWVQEVVRQGRVKIGKKDTKEILADMLSVSSSMKSLKYVIPPLFFSNLVGTGFPLEHS